MAQGTGNGTHLHISSLHFPVTFSAIFHCISNIRYSVRHFPLHFPSISLHFLTAKCWKRAGGMRIHHDSVMPHRFTRDPYFPLDAMCTIHYLTDVTEESPAFAVIPRSNRARVRSHAIY